MRPLLIACCAIFLITFFACGSSDTTSTAEAPDFKIIVGGVPQGTAFLIGTLADQRFKVDSAQISQNGEVSFKRDTPYDGGFYYVLYPDNTAIQALIDEDQTFTIRTSIDNLLGNIKVEGSLDNQLLYESLSFENELQPRINEVAESIRNTPTTDPNHVILLGKQDVMVMQRKNYLQALFTKYPDTFFTHFKRSGQNPDLREVRFPDGSVDQATQVYLYRTEFWDNVDFSDERLIRTPVIANKLTRYITELTPQHPDSINKVANDLLGQVLDYPEYLKFFANWIALQYEPTKTSLMDPEAVYVNMVQNYFTYERAFWSDSAQIYALQLRAHEMANSLVGNKGPEVTAPDPQGNPRSTSELTAPYLIVYLYNPTCEHCMIETPKMVNFAREWKNKGVDVFGIAVDTNDQEWKDYIAKTGMPWVNVFDPSNPAIYAKYYVDVTPEIYVLDADRTIIAKNLKVDQIAEVIERNQRSAQ